MPTEQASGTQTAVISTEHTLSTPATNHTFVLAVDLTNMASGDTTTLRVYHKIKSGGSFVLLYEQAFVDAQTVPLVISIPVPSVYGSQYTLKQTAGTGRAYDWSLLSIDV